MNKDRGKRVKTKKKKKNDQENFKLSNQSYPLKTEKKKATFEGSFQGWNFVHSLLFKNLISLQIIVYVYIWIKFEEKF